MSDGRHRLSGFEYRKQAAKRKSKDDEVMSKTRKLSSYFITNQTGADSSNTTEKSAFPGQTSNSADVSQKSNEFDDEDRKQCSDAELEEPKSELLSSSISASQDKIDDEESSENPYQNLKRRPSAFGKAVDRDHGDEGSTESTKTTRLDEKNVTFSDDPAAWRMNDLFRDYIAEHNYEQNKHLDFSQSKRVNNNVVRYLNLSLFERKLLNGEKIPRLWLVYSQSKGSVYCAPCLLFGGESSFADKDGFSDWKNAATRMCKHENSEKHQSCLKSLKDRASALGRIDKTLTAEYDKEVAYWQNVLKRVVAVIKNLASRGLPFRGHDEKFGSLHHGNYLMSLELIAEFDPFLSEHISRFGNKGIGSTSYLSKTICEEFIEILAGKVLDIIIQEVDYTKYYSLIVDSTSDISHVDQLCLILRYVKKGGMPVERFIKFLQNVGHKAADMDDAVTSTLKTMRIPIENCLGQSYDTARNMSGIYAGLQKLIKNRNKYAEYVPCAAHSLNLVGTHAVESCSTAADYFNDLQSLYNFFTASTSRWDILQSYCEKSKRISVKSLSVTRWSARNDAVCTLDQYYTEILKALYHIENDVSQKAVTRSEAKGIRDRFESLETAFMQCLWNFLLPRFNSVSKKLQSTQTNPSEVVQLYKSLIKTVGDARDDFDFFEKKAFELSVNQEYKTIVCRVKRRKIYDDETRTGEVTLLEEDYFRVNTYNVIFDNLLSDLREKCRKYEKIFEKFSVLIDLGNLDNANIRIKAKNLQEAFSQDLESSMDDELIHFKAYFDCDQQNSKRLTPIETFEFLKKNGLDTVFPNVDIAYRMFLCLAVTNCSGERSFSCLKRIKNYLRSTICQSRLNSLALLSIEAEILRSIDCDNVIHDFAVRKARRKNM